MTKTIFAVLFLLFISCEDSNPVENSKNNWEKNIFLNQRPNGINIENQSDRTIHYSLIKGEEFDSLSTTFTGIPSNDSSKLRGSIIPKNGVAISNSPFNSSDSLSFVFWDKDYADPKDIPRIDFRLF